jgi:hypothetical protein
MYIKDIISRLNKHVIRIANTNYYIASKVEDELNDIACRAVSWHVDDFINQAQLAEGEDWEEWYDKDEFERALCLMIEKHDASIGINWDTVDYYLETYCRKKYPPIGINKKK